MTKSYLLYLLCLLLCWTVDLSHWQEWGVLDEKYASEVEEAVPRRVWVYASNLGRLVEAVLVIAKKVLSLLKLFA